MSFKHCIFNLYRNYVLLLSRIGVKNKKDEIDKQTGLYVITIAYNQAKLIEKQIEMVKKYVQDEDYKQVIVDNSPNKAVRKEIKTVCDREKVEYVAVPHYIDRLIGTRLLGYGLSHGAALNWMFYNYLMPRCPFCFVLLDHDIFPLRGFSFMEKLGRRDFYGVGRIRDVGWYLWPGWCIFRYDAIAKRKPNFLPVFKDDTYLDAGGGNYTRVYCHYDINEMEFPDVITKRIKKTVGLNTHDDIYHSDCIQYIDDSWLHVINGSNYAHIPGKDDLVNIILMKLDEN